MTFADACELARELPAVEVGTSYGTPALKVKGKLMVRLTAVNAATLYPLLEEGWRQVAPKRLHPRPEA